MCRRRVILMSLCVSVGWRRLLMRFSGLRIVLVRVLVLLDGLRLIRGLCLWVCWRRIIRVNLRCRLILYRWARLVWIVSLLSVLVI